MEQKICPYYGIWNFDNVDTPLCEVDNYETSCDGRNYTECWKFIECRKLFDNY